MKSMYFKRGFILLTIFTVFLNLLSCSDSDDDNNVRIPDIYVEDFWNQFEWNELLVKEMELWTVLGWDEDSWESDDRYTWPESEFKLWNELSELEVNAAALLGYTPEIWDNLTIRKPNINLVEFWDQFLWAELLPREMELWHVLGWNEMNWESDEPEDWPESEFKYWEELSEYEIEAATLLWYDQITWDGS